MGGGTPGPCALTLPEVLEISRWPSPTCCLNAVDVGRGQRPTDPGTLCQVTTTPIAGSAPSVLTLRARREPAGRGPSPTGPGTLCQVITIPIAGCAPSELALRARPPHLERQCACGDTALDRYHYGGHTATFKTERWHLEGKAARPGRRKF